ncbi:4-(cytidine 5'-diphospho)-2-C-methyl-D-erythritol kinase [Microlunatus sp. GCM10028923]|uniref:4-(cytidine 5'-diphospho)-2-C-methyl-D-erythritol kinase n=1 Tax=Microlunatus sp. GCM10028923 TaxID=3273400 RepID=UPI003615EE87
MVAALPPTGVRVRVPAKINLALKVGPPRSDGFHPLATVFHAVSLYDEVIAEPAPSGEFTVEVTGEDAELVPTDDTNLAIRAARGLAETYAPAEGVRLSIKKSIPVAGGLAGGSANGAAALVACAELWALDLEQEELLALAAELGSDVPFALVGGTAIGSGRGERLVPALARGCYQWVLAFSDEGLSTPKVYGLYDDLGGRTAPAPSVSDELMNALRAGDAAALGAALDNDLQAAALTLRPKLRRVLDTGLELGALGAVVSGSGPTVAFLAATESAAIELSVRLSAEGICRTVRRAVGPVHGARVIA